MTQRKCDLARRTPRAPPSGARPGGRAHQRVPGGLACHGAQPGTARKDMQQLLVSKDDVLPKQHERNQSLDQKNSEAPNIKEEQGELWSEGEEKPQSSQLHQSQRDESREVTRLSTNSTELRKMKTEADGDDCGRFQPTNSSDLQPNADDMQKLLVIKEEILPEQQACNLSADQEDIKEVQEKLYISQQLEIDIAKIPFTAVPVKSENYEKPQSSQDNPCQSDESTEPEPAASSSSTHRTLTEQAYREDYGGPQPASNSGPNSPLQSDTNGGNSDSSETETDDSVEWNQTRDLSSGFNCLKNRNVCVSPSSSNIPKNQLNCSECGKVCGHMKYFMQHKGRHAGEKPFGCPECGKKFGLKGNLTKHMRIHTAEKLFGCTKCSKRFHLKGNLTKHMRIHTGGKPFGCSECGKRFRQKGSLTRHTRIHTGEKPFVCSECGKRFGQKDNLNMHMIIHTGQKPFVCAECGERFGQKVHLKIHIRIHTGQKPFRCSECDKRFGQKGHLTRHMRIHTGQKKNTLNY
ncbi:zinc finger protein 502-like [Thalassophryne amazonica]|uniref:zinc finger protein 502-like n=1 Tax=Thalassophryne amazonica TaxID=390379 RepID=UPI00147175BD|nr:zinc finger protein 502-like [Thalassophryne amazonica]